MAVKFSDIRTRVVARKTRDTSPGHEEEKKHNPASLSLCDRLTVVRRGRDVLEDIYVKGTKAACLSYDMKPTWGSTEASALIPPDWSCLLSEAVGGAPLPRNGGDRALLPLASIRCQRPVSRRCPN